LFYAKKQTSFGNLVAFFKNKEQASIEESTEFILELIESQLLTPELEPCITGIDPFRKLIHMLKKVKGVKDLPVLKKILNLVNYSNTKGILLYQEIESLLKSVKEPPDTLKNILQTDLYLSLNANKINDELVKTILGQLDELAVLVKQRENKHIQNFKNKFKSMFEGEEIPLSIALDADIGIGYANNDDESFGGSDIIDCIPIKSDYENKPSIEFNAGKSFILKKYIEFIQGKLPGIEIYENELLALRNDSDLYYFSNSLSIIGNLLKKNNKIDAGNFVFVLNAMGGPNGANLLARFADTGNTIFDISKEIVQEEEKEDPKTIYAEIVHLPQARVGNVILRPLLRGYEIPYVGISGAGLENQIPVSDIYVSVNKDKVMLRSKRLNKFIIPRLTSATNYTADSLPVYKFLFDMQHVDSALPAYWDWGFLRAQKYLPRVSYKNIILKKARWLISVEDIKSSTLTDTELSGLKHFLQELEIPKRVVYVEHDNELLIDIENENCLKLLLQYVKKNKSVIIEEFLFTEENCIIKNIEGAPFTNELIIPVKALFKGNQFEKPQIQRKKQDVIRKFPPGSEWSYFKIYCGYKSAEKLLKKMLFEFIKKSLDSNDFEKFFFIRFKDEFAHIRIRFYNSNLKKEKSYQGKFLSFLNVLLKKGIIQNIVMDTYTRELERYGAEIIENIENLFFTDSLATLKFINLADDEQGEIHRIIYALRGIDTLLNDFSLPLPVKTDMMKMVANSHLQQFGGNRMLRKEINDKYRKYQNMIFSHMNPLNDIKNDFAAVAEILSVRSRMNILPINEILSKNIQPDLLRLLPDLIHMFMNRLFIAQQRKYELVIYHFLEKYYTSQTAIISKRQTADL
jgi:thiopeptide-type bacteriocin biosynthesis domain